MSNATAKDWLAKCTTLLLRRSLPLLWAGLLFGLVFLISETTIDHGVRAQNREFRQELSRLKSRVVQLKRTAETLRAEVARLRHDPKESVYHARIELGMVRPGEMVYRFSETHESDGVESR